MHFAHFFVPANFLQLLAHFIKPKKFRKKNMDMDMLHMGSRQATATWIRGSCSSCFNAQKNNIPHKIFI